MERLVAARAVTGRARMPPFPT